ncbi:MULTISPECIES: hypothetical protein [unclassified Bradyrhizobium]|uniref:hypothetical protein n=1 Tax=unclassified Bradyrhizobium TaxID=2631580 RepID=UPI002478AF54|nr:MULTISPECIES: hypothetical protein [unclassified Bradyrhizobium]WGS19208.1 hypothetical protein MTX22_33010 [Bradyrhizobium sp. ISRA463]WGS26045.1 hypothetical protein MTX19_30535 [Bradyrhizobium sp. ISRA464]
MLSAFETGSFRTGTYDPGLAIPGFKSVHLRRQPLVSHITSGAGTEFEDAKGRHRGEPPMGDEMMSLCAVEEKTPLYDLLREMVGVAAQPPRWRTCWRAVNGSILRSKPWSCYGPATGLLVAPTPTNSAWHWRAIVSKRGILLLDEPPGARDRCRDVLNGKSAIARR